MNPPLTDTALLDELRRCVSRARPELDTGQGVKLLYSDVASLSNRIWTVGLNPGGYHSEPDQWCRDPGEHDYRDGYRTQGVAELRPGGLQLRKQLGLMMEWLGADWSETLSLNLVPFRSAAWRNMPRQWRKAAIRFAMQEFWPLLLSNRQPSLIVCFGGEAARTLRRLLGHPSATAYPVGWRLPKGEVTADVSEGGKVALLRLPHLSTFRIFGRRGGAGAPELAHLRDDPRLVRALRRARQRQTPTSRR